MMMSNGFNFLPSPYGPVSFNIPTFYPPSVPGGPSTHQHRSRPSKPAVLKLYDLETSKESDVIRLILTYGQIPFKEKRLYEDEWLEMKEHLPILRLSKKSKIFQRHVILRYLARELNLYGTNNADQAVVDTVLDVIRSLDEHVNQQRLNANNAEQGKQQRQEVLAHHGQWYLEQLDEIFGTYPRHGPLYLGSQISVADLVVYHTLHEFLKIDAKLIEPFSHLKALRSRLDKNPQLNHFYQQLQGKRQRVVEIVPSKSPAVPVPEKEKEAIEVTKLVSPIVVEEVIEATRKKLPVVVEEVPELLDSESLLM